LFKNNHIIIITYHILNFILIDRVAIQDEIDKGFLANCRLNRINLGPRGPHPIGSYETCCNKTSISPALSWFMLNHGNLSILLHPLTRFEVRDHTDRSMFLGPRVPLDTSVLADDLGDNLDHCTPIETHGMSTNTIPRKNPPKWIITHVACTSVGWNYDY